MRRRLAIAAVACAIVAALGIAALATLGPDAVVDQTAAWVVALAVTILACVATVMTAVFSMVLPAFGSSAPVAVLQQAAAEGRDGLARVITASPTGAKLNNAWVYDVDLVVDGTAAPTYRARDRVRVRRRGGASLGAGAIVAVVRPWVDSPSVVVTAGPDGVPQDSIVPLDAPGWVA